MTDDKMDTADRDCVRCHGAIMSNERTERDGAI